MPSRRKSVRLQNSAPSLAQEALAQYVTTKQAAEMLGTDDSNIRHALLDGRLQGTKLGHYWLVFLPSLKAYLDQSPGRQTTLQKTQNFTNRRLNGQGIHLARSSSYTASFFPLVKAFK